MKAILVRHTQIATNAAGLCYGRFDVACAETFTEEAAALQSSLPWQPSAVWSSPASRCTNLATRLARAAPVQIDERLQELNFGEWEGQRWEAFQDAASDSWALDPWNLRPPAGETGLELWARVAQLREQVLALPATTRLLIVTHAGVIRCWQALAAAQPAGSNVFDLAVGYGKIWPAL